jgi:D-alanyl-D-alanine endopeptidase (penicillin-binding protein 7)
MRLIFKCLVAFLFCTSAYAQHPFKITADSWIVANSDGTVIQGLHTQEIRSIASITKLMTAMVVLDARQDLDEKINGYTRSELIQLALVRSDNKAAEILCDNYVTGRIGCVRAMNNKAVTLEMYNTKYVEPTGLSVFNTSTAEDLVKLVVEASKYNEVNQAAHTASLTVHKRKHLVMGHNTNPNIAKHNFIVSKTGFIHAAGGCIAVMVDTDVGRKIVIVLGSKNTHTRIPEAEYIFKNY